MPMGQFEVMTASTFPYYIGIVGIAVSTLSLILSFIEKDKEFLSISYLKSLDFKTTIGFIFAMLFYGFTIRSLGFVIATIIFLSIGFILLKERNIKKILLISIGVSLGFYLLLNNVLGVYIEPGIIAQYFMEDES